MYTMIIAIGTVFVDFLCYFAIKRGVGESLKKKDIILMMIISTLANICWLLMSILNQEIVYLAISIVSFGFVLLYLLPKTIKIMKTI